MILYNNLYNSRLPDVDGPETRQLPDGEKIDAHLQLSFLCPGVLGKYVENKCCAVDNFDPLCVLVLAVLLIEGKLEIFLLCW